MGSRMQRIAIDAESRVISWVQKSVERKLVGMLLMDTKSAFDHASRNCLIHTIEGMEADAGLMRWIN